MREGPIESGGGGHGSDLRSSQGYGLAVFRTMTAEERAIFQGLIDSFYQRFLNIVQEGRSNLQMEQIKRLADGRIYTGEQAEAAGLVDEIGYLEDAIALAKKKAGLTEARVVTYHVLVNTPTTCTPSC